MVNCIDISLYFRIASGFISGCFYADRVGEIGPSISEQDISKKYVLPDQEPLSADDEMSEEESPSEGVSSDDAGDEEVLGHACLVPSWQ